MNATTKARSGNGGYWMLVGLVALLVTPMVIGHFVITPAAEPAQQTSVPAQ